MVGLFAVSSLVPCEELTETPEGRGGRGRVDREIDGPWMSRVVVRWGKGETANEWISGAVC